MRTKIRIFSFRPRILPCERCFHETFKNCFPDWNYFCPCHRHPGPFYIRLDRPQCRNRPFCAGERIRLGTYEAAFLSHAAVFPFSDFQIQERIPLHYRFPLLRHPGGDFSDSRFLLCLYRSFGQKCLFPGHRHIYPERSDRFSALLQAYPLLPSEAIYPFAMHSDRASLCLFFTLYLASAGPKIFHPPTHRPQFHRFARRCRFPGWAPGSKAAQTLPASAQRYHGCSPAYSSWSSRLP